MHAVKKVFHSIKHITGITRSLILPPQKVRMGNIGVANVKLTEHLLFVLIELTMGKRVKKIRNNSSSFISCGSILVVLQLTTDIPVQKWFIHLALPTGQYQPSLAARSPRLLHWILMARYPNKTND